MPFQFVSNRNAQHSTICLLLASLFFYSCTDYSGYKAYQEINQGGWHIDSTIVFPFAVKQTEQPQKFGYIVRNALDYPFANLYVRYHIIAPQGDTMQLGIQESNLMDPISGRPLGAGSGGIYEHQITLSESLHFSDTGQYILSLQQYMRMDTLPSILAMGMFMEPEKPEAN